MKERPIIFNSDMVRAILDGRKSRTRRLRGLNEINKNPNEWIWRAPELSPMDGIYAFQNDMRKDVQYIRCPYGVVGDLLYIRENIRTACYPYQDGKFNYGAALIEYVADEQLVICPDENYDWWRHNWGIRPSTIIPSIHMPKWAARLWLENAAIRVERLKEISDHDIICEGFETREEFFGYIIKLNRAKSPEEFLNKWVWVIEFKRVEQIE